MTSTDPRPPSSGVAGPAAQFPRQMSQVSLPRLAAPTQSGRPDSGWYIALIVVAGVIVVVGLARPAWAPRLALICLVLTATFIAASWLRSLLARTEAESRSVEVESDQVTAGDGADTVSDSGADSGADGATTENDGGRPGSRDTPLAVAELRDGRGPAGLSQRGMQYLRFVASEQLWSRYRLNLVHQPHWPEIRSRVSPELWQAINYQLPPTGGYLQPDQLNRLLTEIERI